MKKILITALALSIVILIGGCSDNLKDATDFTSIEDPNLVPESFIGSPNSGVIWLRGIERQMSNVFNELITVAEIGSDNYDNVNTFFNQFLDILDIRPDDTDMRDTHNDFARLREMTIFGINDVAPNDPVISDNTIAELTFFRGVFNLFAGMYFSELPNEVNGIPITSVEHYNLAIESFNSAIALNPLPEYYLARARAFYYLGMQSEAVSDASTVISLNNTLLRTIRFDNLNGPDNTMQDAIFDRGQFDDLQPLPSLDFLDPKFSFLSADEDSPIPFLKAEEAYLIIAEAGFADGNMTVVQDNLTSLLNLISTREVRSINDGVEGRTQGAPGSRPDNSSVVVNGRPNLVLTRNEGEIMIPSISGTSLTQTDINTMINDDSSLELFYRTRQEVFFAEGIRFADMGVKLIMDLTEISGNPNVSEGDSGTIPVIPSFIDTIKDQLDAITYDPITGQATTVINLNQVLVQNKTSNEVLPFH